MNRILQVLGWVALTSAVWTAATFEWGPTPYTNPTLKVVDRGVGYVDVMIAFKKEDGCAFQRMNFIGEELGLEVPLTGVDIAGNKDDTRQVGYHVATMRVTLTSDNIESIKFFTQHDCGGKIVSREFGEADVPEKPDGEVSLIEQLQQQVQELTQEVYK